MKCRGPEHPRLTDKIRCYEASYIMASFRSKIYCDTQCPIRKAKQKEDDS